MKQDLNELKQLLKDYYNVRDQHMPFPGIWLSLSLKPEYLKATQAKYNMMDMYDSFFAEMEEGPVIVVCSDLNELKQHIQEMYISSEIDEVKLYQYKSLFIVVDEFSKHLRKVLNNPCFKQISLNELDLEVS